MNTEAERYLKARRDDAVQWLQERDENATTGRAAAEHAAKVIELHDQLEAGEAPCREMAIIELMRVAMSFEHQRQLTRNASTRRGSSKRHPWAIELADELAKRHAKLTTEAWNGIPEINYEVYAGYKVSRQGVPNGRGDYVDGLCARGEDDEHFYLTKASFRINYFARANRGV